MKAMDSNWYNKVWSLDAKNYSWVENTEHEVDFIIKALSLKGTERILDLACGFGRHALEFARRGYEVVGIDITKAFIEDAKNEAKREHLSAQFICSDIREISFENEFDVVLNLADGAIGYLENERENLKIFDVIAKALKPGGMHMMDIVSADYADNHFPCQLWDAGERGISLSRFEWDRDSCIMIYGQVDTLYDTPLKKPILEEGCPTRLYHELEIENIMGSRGMHVLHTYSDYNGAPASCNALQLMVVSQKNK